MTTQFTHWPNGSRIAVAITVMFETFAEGKWSPHSAQRWQVKPGVVDHQAITWAQYGGKAGVWRIIRTLDDYGVPATFCTSARSAERYPDAMRQILRSGHDIAAHGYTQDQHLAGTTPDEERGIIRRSIEVLERSSGTRPLGWLSPILAWTPHTDEILAEEKLIWHGDANYIDLPIRVHTRHGPVAHIPHSDYTDNRVLWLSPQDYHDSYRGTFDYLYEREPLSLLVMTVHAHFGGRPLMTAMFERLLRYFAGFPGVWFARHRELAQWALSGATDEVTYAQRFFR